MRMKMMRMRIRKMMRSLRSIRMRIIRRVKVVRGYEDVDEDEENENEDEDEEDEDDKMMSMKSMRFAIKAEAAPAGTTQFCYERRFCTTKPHVRPAETGQTICLRPSRRITVFHRQKPFSKVMRKSYFLNYTNPGIAGILFLNGPNRTVQTHSDSFGLKIYGT